MTRAVLVAFVCALAALGAPAPVAAAPAGPNQQGPYGTPPWQESPGGYAGDNGTPTPQDWDRDVANIDTAIAANPAAPLLFIGDSITYRQPIYGTHAWDEYFADRAVDAGIGGDTTQNVLERIDQGRQLQTATPATIVVLIGTNDFHHGWTAAQVTFGIIRVLRTLHAKVPAANIVDVSLLPKYTPANPEWDDVTQVNAQLAHDVPSLGCAYSYLNAWPLMVTTNTNGTQEQTPGLFNPAQVHPTSAGYDVLDQAIANMPAVQEANGDHE